MIEFEIVTPRILLSYRRDDTAAHAGRLYDKLRQRFGHNVFLDIDSIQPGEDFHEALNASVASCDCLIAVIGRAWLNTPGQDGRPRLTNPDDFVRIEICAALARGIRVVPVLVDGATMPSATELPEALAPLARRQAFEISDTRFHDDAGRLIQALSGSGRPRARTTASTRFLQMVAATLLAGVAGLGGYSYFTRVASNKIRVALPVAQGPAPTSGQPVSQPTGPVKKMLPPPSVVAEVEQRSANTSWKAPAPVASPALGISGPQGTIIVYATQYGGVASEIATQRNGLYTKHLLEALRRPGIDFMTALGEVRRQVMAESGGRQEPWVSHSDSGSLVLLPAPPKRKAVALTVGNNNYKNLPGLSNAKRDATDMAAFLETAGFAVDMVLDGSRDAITSALTRNFATRARGIALLPPNPDVALFFFSGHAASIAGFNYLAPVDSELAGEGIFKTQGISEQEILQTLALSNASMKVVIIDACRDNPFANLGK